MRGFLASGVCYYDVPDFLVGWISPQVTKSAEFSRG
jgi:hypothetical protein